MSAQVIQIRDYQPKRKEEKLKEQAAEILSQVGHPEVKTGAAVGNEFPNEMVPYHGSGIDGLVYESSIGFVAPDKDPA